MLADQVVGWATLELPWRDNLELARMRIIVHPDRRRQGLGTRLLELVLAAAIENGRTSIATLAWVGTDGVPFLAARGFSTSGQHPYEVRRLDLHDTPTARWQQLYDEAAPRAADYELSRLVGPTPDDLLDGLVALHEAINDAPDGRHLAGARRVRRRSGYARYDEAMTVAAAARSTGVLARHRPHRGLGGDDAFSASTSSHPEYAFQEDTSVVRAHRGHRLGLLLKAEMLLWLHDRHGRRSRPIDTWNATSTTPT